MKKLTLRDFTERQEIVRRRWISKKVVVTYLTPNTIEGRVEEIRASHIELLTKKGRLFLATSAVKEMKSI